MNVHSLSNPRLQTRFLDLVPSQCPSVQRMATTSMDRKIIPEDFVRRFPPKNPYLVGVSGGRDSVALLHALSGRGYCKVVVCHLDHTLRGRASAADARFVEKLARAAGFAFVTARANVGRRAKETKQSLETAARNARYEFFAAVARRRRCRTIFTGHHADDLVETF